MTAACRAAGISRTMAYKARRSDAEFAEAWDDIDQAVTDALERECLRRAMEGVVRFKYDNRGNLLCEERVYSDSLALAMLRARAPRYRETTRLEHAGVEGEPLRFAVDGGPEVLEAARLLRDRMAGA